ncbi:MAG: hypothetical protein ABIP19_08025 [Dermatophilaceae bacterium]
MTLHVLAATIWVGGQIVLAALVGPLRRAAPESVAPAARAFARVGWPAFAVLIVTGMWNLSVGGPLGGAYQTTLMVKLLLVALSGVVPVCTPSPRGLRSKVSGGRSACWGRWAH